jgi:hypothetical protein
VNTEKEKSKKVVKRPTFKDGRKSERIKILKKLFFVEIH